MTSQYEKHKFGNVVKSVNRNVYHHYAQKMNSIYWPNRIKYFL